MLRIDRERSAIRLLAAVRSLTPGPWFTVIQAEPQMVRRASNRLPEPELRHLVDLQRRLPNPRSAAKPCIFLGPQGLG